MTAGLVELKTLLEEIECDTDFVALASQLRPRLNSFVSWGTIQSDERNLLTSFLNLKNSRPEGLYGPLLVRLLAAFEQYMRTLIAWAVENISSAAGCYDDLSGGVGQRNRVLTGRVLAHLDSPRDHLSMDIDELIKNLASCRSGTDTGFRLNAIVFSAAISGVSPSHIEDALANIDIRDFWDDVGGDASLGARLGTKGARQTGHVASVK